MPLTGDTFVTDVFLRRFEDEDISVTPSVTSPRKHHVFGGMDGE